MPDATVIRGDARQIDLSQFQPPYRAMIADPPWPYDNNMSQNPRYGGYTYTPMTMAEIYAVPVPQLAADNSILYLWGTWPKLPFVLRTLEAWGFTYVTGFPWIKLTMDRCRPVYRTGHWVAACSEYVFIGRKGHVSPPPPPRDLGLLSPSLQHSRKPDDLHSMIENKFPGPYLELFGRRSRPGWTVFGNEVTTLLI